VLSAAGNPVYSEGKVLSSFEFSLMSDYELLYSYIVIKCDFEFPDNVKFPSIPCYVDDTTTVYPRVGEAVLTGAEYILARNQKCTFAFHEIYLIPFETTKDKLKEKENRLEFQSLPFRGLIKDLQKKRRDHEKGTFLNALYKELGNSIYGLVVRGMANKMNFDVQVGKTIRMESNEITNPIIAS
jgi:hypothetical protein